MAAAADLAWRLAPGGLDLHVESQFSWVARVIPAYAGANAWVIEFTDGGRSAPMPLAKAITTAESTVIVAANQRAGKANR